MNLRRYAAGRACVARIPGVCNGNPETTVLAHLKRGWCGSIKPPDICGVDACSDCHDVIDGRRHVPGLTRTDIDALLLRALVQQLVIYHEADILRW